ncbi:MAG TPA: Crp/Fnr family transcriptional regulator [Azospirillum sp.]|nr:Crp/Fnr family transcriptional regulator [Azospirillum sp.]
MESQLYHVLARNPLFGPMPAADRERILGYARPVTYAEGDFLFQEGDAPLALFLIVSGAVELSIAAGAGRTGVIGVLGSGDATGEVAVLDGGPYPVSARALERVVALAIPAGAFMRHVEERAELVRGVMAGTSMALRALLRENAELKAKPTVERLCGFLLGLVEQSAGTAMVKLPYEKRVLAGTLGVSPESLSRAFGRLRRVGVTTGRTDVVVIHDVAHLRELVGAGALGEAH